MLMALGQAATLDHIGGCDLCCSRGHVCGFCEIYTATRDQVEVIFGDPIDVPVVHAVTKNHGTFTISKEATSAVVSMTVDSQSKKRNREDFCSNPYPQPNPQIKNNNNKNQPRQETTEENC